MNQQLTTKDTLKVGLIVALLIVLGGAGWFGLQKVNAAGEDSRMAAQMQREAGITSVISAASSPAEGRMTQQMEREAALAPVASAPSGEEAEPKNQ